MKNPKKIYLIKYNEDNEELEEILWCEDDIYGNGIEYQLKKEDKE